MKNTLRIQNLSCKIEGKIIFDHINFTVGSGQALLVKGPNGTGKSTLLKSIISENVTNQVQGTIYWNNHIIEDPYSWKYFKNKIHSVDHLNPFLEDETCYGNINYWSNVYGYSDLNFKSLNEMGLYHLSNTPVKHLSLGQQKRLNLTRLLTSFRPIWILDEPTLGLDKQAVNLLEQILLEHQKDGGISVVATHSDIQLTKVKMIVL